MVYFLTVLCLKAKIIYKFEKCFCSNAKVFSKSRNRFVLIRAKVKKHYLRPVKIKITMESFEYIDLGQIAYADALERQTQAFEQLLAAKKQGKEGRSRLFFCEHEPVFTIGKSGKEANLLVSEALLAQRGIKFYHISRGGDITYHGPGQITGYPVFDLEHWHLGLKAYIWRLEEVVIRFLKGYGVLGMRLEGATGVWLDPYETSRARKICAIGVKSSRYVTMHGFALNINTDLDYFSLINPCGFTDKGVTSLSRELKKPLDFERCKTELLQSFGEMFP